MKQLAILFCSLLISCSQLLENGKGPFSVFPALDLLPNSQAPVVLSAAPLNEQNAVSPYSEISILFSKDMNKTVTEGSFTLRNGSISVDGLFSWIDKMMVFKPKAILSQAGQYRYTLLGSKAESSEGVNLIRDYSSNFYVNEDSQQPELVSTIPSNGAVGIQTNTTIQLTFSKAMKLSSILTNISSSPQISFDFPAATLSGDGTTVTLILLTPLAFGTNYTLTIPASIQDSSGNTLIKSYQLNFTVGNDFVKPNFTEISSTTVTNFVATEYITVAGFEKDDSFFIQFDEPILPSSINDAISFTPSVTYTIQDVSANSTRFRITPSSVLDIDTVYQMKVSDQIRDIQNNTLTKAYVYNIKINGPRSRPLWVRGIYLDQPTTIQLNTSIISSINSDGGVGPNYNLETGTNGFYIYFCRGETLATCDITSSPRDLSLQLSSIDFDVRYDFGPNIGSPYLNLPVDVSPLPTDRFLMRTRLFSFAPNPSTYIFTVKGGKQGVIDQYGNYMKQDFNFRFRLNP